jgi:hypothetical protein
LRHLLMHEQATLQKQQQAAQAAAPPQNAPGGGQAMRNSNRESGDIEDEPSGNGQRADNRGPE